VQKQVKSKAAYLRVPPLEIVTFRSLL